MIFFYSPKKDNLAGTEGFPIEVNRIETTTGSFSERSVIAIASVFDNALETIKGSMEQLRLQNIYVSNSVQGQAA